MAISFTGMINANVSPIEKEASAIEAIDTQAPAKSLENGLDEQELGVSPKTDPAKYLEKKLDQIAHAYQRSDFSLEHITQVINNNKKVTEKIDKKAVLEHIKSIRMLIAMILMRDLKTTAPTAERIQELVGYLQHITTAIEKLIASNLQTIEPLDVEKLQAITIKRGKTQLDEQKLDKDINELNRKIELLTNKSNNVGLTTLNKTYKSIEKFFQEKFGADGRGKYVVAGTLIGGFLSYYFLSRTDDDSLASLGIIGNGLTWIKNVPLRGTPIIGNARSIDAVKLNGEIVLGSDGKPLSKYVPSTGLITRIEELFTDKYKLFSLDPNTYQLWPLLFAPYAFHYIQKAVDKGKKTVASWGRTLRGDPEETTINGFNVEVFSDVNFDHFIGKEDLKTTFDSIIEYLLEPERFARTGSSIQHMLFCGKTRAGKTFFAKCVQGEAIKRAIEKNAKNKVIQMWSASPELITGTPGGLTSIISYFRYGQRTPTILFIDEIDMLNWQRDKDAENLSHALAALSGIDTSDRGAPVIVIGATNLPEHLDQALLQPGRFGKIVWFDYPSFEERMLFIAKELEKQGAFAINEDYLMTFAKETEGRSFEDLRLVITSALNRAKGRKETVNESHLEEAFDEEVRHIVYDNTLDLTDVQKQIVAAHIAGRSMITALCEPNNNISKATIRAITKSINEQSIFDKMNGAKDKSKNLIKEREIHEFGALFTLEKQMPGKSILTQEQREAKIKVMIAGLMAEKILFGNVSYSYNAKVMDDAFDIVLSMTCEGIDLSKLSQNEQNMFKEQARAHLKELQADVEAKLKNKEIALKKLIAELIESKTLFGEEIYAIIGQ